MLRNTNTQYGSVSKAFHWIMSASIISLVIAGFTMINLKNGDTKWQIYELHKATGMIILMLVPFRLIWRMSQTRPTLQMLPKHEKTTAVLGQRTLYLIMFLMPLSGWFMSTAAGYAPSIFGLFTISAPIAETKANSDIFHSVHWYTAWSLSLMLVGHIGFALKNHIADKNMVLRRMLPGKMKAPLQP